MKRKIIAAAAASCFALGMGATAAAAAPPDGAGERGQPAGAACLVDGVSFLLDNDLLVTVAQEGFLGLSLPEVLALHRTSPGLFDGDPGDIGNWC
jgi:hypothetical protein